MYVFAFLKLAIAVCRGGNHRSIRESRVLAIQDGAAPANAEPRVGQCRVFRGIARRVPSFLPKLEACVGYPSSKTRGSYDFEAAEPRVGGLGEARTRWN